MAQVKKFNLFILAFVLLSATSCLNERLKTPPPEFLISKDKMALILADMQIADASLKLDGKYGDSLKIYSAVYYQEILRLHEVSLEHFNTSHQYYLESPQEYAIISEKIIEILSQYEAENM